MREMSFSLYGPMKVVVCYIIFTMVLHVIGPWEYRDESLLWAYVFMAAVLAAFVLGYASVISKMPRFFELNEAVSWRNLNRFLTVSKIGLTLQFLLISALFILDIVAGKVSIESVFNPGQTYINALEVAYLEGDGSFLVQVRTLAAPIIYLANVFFIYNYSRVGKLWRYCLLITLAIQLVHGVSTRGAQKGFFDLFIMLASVGALNVYLDKQKFMHWLRLSGLLLASIISLFLVFQLSRLSAYDALDYAGSDYIRLIKDGWFFSALGNELGLSLALFVMYISHGYYGLSLCLDLPFEWTYGLGNSFALTSYADQYFGISNIELGTYPFRMQEQFGLPAKMYWHTFFPWVASDLSFFGVVPLMYLIGRGYARSFTDGLLCGSPIGALMFYFLTTLLLYLPANNQLMQSREMTIGFLSVTIYWLVFGARYRGKSVTRVRKF